MTRKPIIFDTGVFIDFRRNFPGSRAGEWITAAISGNIAGSVSLITDLELWIGAVKPEDKISHKKLLREFRRLDITLAIGRRAADLVRPHWKDRTYPRKLPDCIIAATAEYYRLDILTTNPKDYLKLPLNNIKIIDVRNSSIP